MLRVRKKKLNQKHTNKVYKIVKYSLFYVTKNMLYYIYGFIAFNWFLFWLILRSKLNKKEEGNFR